MQFTEVHYSHPFFILNFFHQGVQLTITGDAAQELVSKLQEQMACMGPDQGFTAL